MVVWSGAFNQTLYAQQSSYHFVSPMEKNFPGDQI